jgi:hypothetical protein
MYAMTDLSFVIYVRATPRQVHAVLTDPALLPRWLAGMEFHSDAEEDPGRLTCEWLQTGYLGSNGGTASVARFESVAMGQVTRLTVIHRNLVPGGSFLKVIASGWPMILSSLKSLIETGEPLEFSRCGRRRQTSQKRSKGDLCTRPEYPSRPESPRPWPRPRC